MRTSKKIIFLVFFCVILLFNSKISLAEDSTSNTENGTISMSRVVKDGTYYITCANNEEYALDIKGATLENGANLQIYTKNNSANQKFYISYDGDGYYKISNIKSAKVLDVDSGKKEDGTNIQQYTGNGSSAQRWKIRKNIDGSYNFIAECSGKAMDVDSNKIENGTNVQQWEYTNSYAQRFKLESTDILDDGSIVAIRKADNIETVLDVTNGSAKDGQAIQLYETNDTASQRFEIHKVGDNEVRIRTAASGGWLKEKGKTAGSEVIQAGNSGTAQSDSDIWKVSWDDGIVFTNKESGLRLDVENNATENGTKIQVQSATTTGSQRFLVIRADLIKEDWYEMESPLGTVLDLDDAKSDQGTNIQAWSRTNANNQKFKIIKKDNGYLITTMHSLALDVENASTANEANVRQWEDNSSDCQRWTVEIKDGGYLAFKNVNSGKYLAIENASGNNGANVYQYEEQDTKGQLWRLNRTTFARGWYSSNGSMYCVDPETGKLVTSTTRVDPMMTDPADYGSIYDFDAEGRATWHLPVAEDLPGGTGPDAPIPTPTGDRRQRVLQVALSRLGCSYGLGSIPTGFVCDGLTGWSFATAIGEWFGTEGTLKDASYQWDKIKVTNGIKYNQSELKSGDLVFFGNPQVTQGPGSIDFNGAAYHAAIYYKDGMMINARNSDGISGVVSDTDIPTYFMDWLGGGSPYEAETSRCEIHN